MEVEAHGCSSTIVCTRTDLACGTNLFSTCSADYIGGAHRDLFWAPDESDCLLAPSGVAPHMTPRSQDSSASELSSLSSHSTSPEEVCRPPAYQHCYQSWHMHSEAGMEVPGPVAGPTGHQCLIHTSGYLALSGKPLVPGGLTYYPSQVQD